MKRVWRKKPMKQKTRDLLYSTILLCFSIVGIIYADVSINSNVVKYELARPDRYVQLWFAILAILSVLLIIRTIKRNDESKAPKMIFSSTLVTIGSFLLYLILIPKIGFTLASFIFVTTLSVFYKWKSSDRKWERKDWIRTILIAMAFALILSVGAGLLFRKVLNVRLPDIIF